MKGVGEASESSSSVMDINDLTFNFSYLLDATKATVERAHKLLGDMEAPVR